MDQIPPPAPPTPPEPTKKKGLHPLAWVGIGCGGLLIIGVIAGSLLVGFCNRKVGEFQTRMAADPHKTAAEMIVGMNSDLEMVADNETDGEMTIRVKSSGEEITVSYSDLAAGRFTIKDGKGTVTRVGTADATRIPGWVPRYPAIRDQASVYHQEKPDGVQGVWVFSTDDAPERVEEFFDGEISWSSGGSSSTTTINGMTRLQREFGGGGRELKLIVASQASGAPTQVTLSYAESNP